MRSNPTQFYCLVVLLNWWSERLFSKSSIVYLVSINFNSKCGSPSFKGLFYYWNFILSCASHEVHIDTKKVTPWLGWPKCVRLWFFLVVLGLILVDLTGFSNETEAPGLLSVSFLMEPGFFPFFFSLSYPFCSINAWRTKKHSILQFYKSLWGGSKFW